MQEILDSVSKKFCSFLYHAICSVTIYVNTLISQDDEQRKAFKNNFLRGGAIEKCKDGSQNWGLFAHFYTPLQGLRVNNAKVWFLCDI